MTTQQSFWNERYRAKEYAYGTSPNVFFAQTIAGWNPGSALVPAAGEGRDAIHAARLGWKVTAFDPSEEGKIKCDRLAKIHGVKIDYSVIDALGFRPDPGGYDLIALSYFHLPSAERATHYREYARLLRPGGRIVLEAFSKKQLGRSSGGPKDPDWLFSLEELRKDFASLRLDLAEETETVLDEGLYHQGTGAVVRIIASNIS